LIRVIRGQRVFPRLWPTNWHEYHECREWLLGSVESKCPAASANGCNLLAQPVASLGSVKTKPGSPGQRLPREPGRSIELHRHGPQAEGAGVGAGGAVLRSAAGALQPPAAQQLDPAAQQVADGVQQVAAGVQHADAALHVEAEQLDEAQQFDWQLLVQLLPQLLQLLPQLLPQLDRQRDLPHFDAQQLRAKTSALVKTRPATVISALVTLRNV